jgi:hypothetical protein
MEKFKVYVRGEKISPDQFKDLKMYNAYYHKYAEISEDGGIIEKFNLPTPKDGKMSNAHLFFSGKVEESSALVIIEPFLEGTREEISFEMGIARAKNIPIILLTDTDGYLPNFHLFKSWLGVLNRLNRLKYRSLTLKDKKQIVDVSIEGRYGC